MITVSLISNKQDEINKFLSSYYEKDMNIHKKTFKWSMICHSPAECLNLVTTVIDNDDKYFIQVFINMPEFCVVVNEQNIDDFIKYILLRENIN